MEHTKSASRGQTPTDQKLVAVVEEAWLHGIGTKSDGARYMADHLAVAASRGLITVELDPGVFGRKWRPTPSGLDFLWQRKGLDQ